MNNNSPDLEVVDGVTFELNPLSRTPTQPDRVCLRKNRRAVDRYIELATQFSACRMMEVGVDQGGSTSFFAKLLAPQSLVAVELSSEPVDTVHTFLARHGVDDSVKIHWGMDQSDRAAIPALVDDAFGDKPLDLVVDDASHLFTPSTATFEMLFPRVRPGGLYIIEDWSAAHIWDRLLQETIARDPDGEAARSFRARVESGVSYEAPLSILVCQLVVAAGRMPEWISEIRLFDGFCEVWRGDAEIPRDTPIAEYTGDLAKMMFNT